LPTEAEWEYAARGGNKSRGYKFSGNNYIENVYWFINNAYDKTHPVGLKQANELDIYDMSGNVWEWCYDRYGYFGNKDVVNPIGASSGSTRVIRGGSYLNYAYFCRVSLRYSIDQSSRGNFRDFRVAL
jgi:formylglycine-generating enzyme required for sulfatase activity